MDVDILKPDTGALQIERPLHSASRTSGSDRQGSSSSGVLTPERSSQAYAEPVSEGEEDEDLDLTPGESLVVDLPSMLTGPFEQISQRRRRAHGSHRI